MAPSSVTSVCDSSRFAASAVVKSVWSTRFTVGKALIMRAAARGEIRAEIPPGVLLDTLIGPLYVRLLLTDQRIDNDYIHTVITTVLNGALI